MPCLQLFGCQLHDVCRLPVLLFIRLHDKNLQQMMAMAAKVLDKQPVTKRGGLWLVEICIKFQATAVVQKYLPEGLYLKTPMYSSCLGTIL